MAGHDRVRPEAATEVDRDWHPLVDGEAEPVWREVGVVVQAPWRDGTEASVAERQMRFAELCALIEDAERGSLRGESWDHVARDPLLWELRLTFGEEDARLVLVRGYFHEPESRPRQTVLAKLHVKDVSSGDSATIGELQDEQIDEASDRILACRMDDWGLGRSVRILDRLGR